MSLSTKDFFVGPLIGEGSFGRVLFGKHKASNQSVAIKVVEKVSLRKRHAHLLQAVLQEQRVLKELKGLVYVVDLWASFHDAECLYMVMECVMGGTLSQLIECRHSRDDWVKDSAAAHYGLQILMALQELHGHDILHADLSPTNILVTERGRIKLCDFGCAVKLGSTENCVTDEIMARGTCEFASPEILNSVNPQDLTFAADVWSLGCILYCLVAGESPFHAKSEALTVQKVFDYANEQDATSRQSILFSDAPLDGPWHKLVGPMLEPKPGDRVGMKTSKEDWYSWVLGNSVWSALDLDKDPSVLPATPSWLLRGEDELKDGSRGWSAFLS